MLTANQIRQLFLDFFRSKKHDIVPSAPIVVKNDPTLMFTNAGMNQFKDYFLGNKIPTNPRIADTQKCMRVSGKHNDLEDVGVDTYHHTMFEMLGNWSFGDYFKKEAIEWSWEFLTEVVKLDPSRLYATVFEGNPGENVPRDNESFDFWRALMPESQILLGSKKDNFWEMGDTGPCGPCTEIHYDMRPEQERTQIAGSSLVNKDHPQVIEIWNNVFIQFNRLSNGTLEQLPAKHVDTGMGFERLVRAIQGKSSNYDTDVFMPLIGQIEKISGKKYGQVEATDIAMRVLADHIRSISFAIADGQLPSNNGAGYVIRRILRRGVRYAYSTLQYQQPLLCQLVPVLAAQMGAQFPELLAQQQFVQRVIMEEELSFLRTLDAGLKKFNQIGEQTRSKNSTQIDGETAFELYDTYGFPIDLTRLIARERNLTVDENGFKTAMEAQKERARAATKADAGDWVVLQENPNVQFVGYEEFDVYTHVVKYRDVTQKGKKQYQIVLAQTPFYAESGGQVGDTGTLQFGSQLIEVKDTKKENDLIVHLTDRLPEEIDQPCRAVIDAKRRQQTAGNHSATHLLHSALRQVLGDHVHQKGSLVNPEHLRFDFSHFSKVSDDELQSIEQMVNQKIWENIALEELRNMPIEEATKMGAMALFGEKYGDKVRVIIFDRTYSIELCGGTHVRATGEIGLCKITAETAVAAGVRRIEAVTGHGAYSLSRQESEQLRDIKHLLNNPPDLLKSVRQTIDENTRLRKELEQVLMERAGQLKNSLKQYVEVPAGSNIHFIARRIEVANADMVKKIAYDLRNEVKNLFLVLAAVIDDKPHITVMIDEDLVQSKGYNAANIVRELAKNVQGGGGGQAFYATAGGKDTGGIDKVIVAAQSWVANNV